MFRFNKKTWHNYPSTTTPVTAEELGRIEEALDYAHHTETLTNTNLKNVHGRNGLYYVSINQGNTDLPPGERYGVLRVLNWGNGAFRQLFTNLFGDTYQRYYWATADEWSEWEDPFDKVYTQPLERVLDVDLDTVPEVSKFLTKATRVHNAPPSMSEVGSDAVFERIYTIQRWTTSGGAHFQRRIFGNEWLPWETTHDPNNTPSYPLLGSQSRASLWKNRTSLGEAYWIGDYRP